MTDFSELVTTWAPNPRCERGFAFQINSNEDGSKIVYGSEKNLVMRDVEDPTRCTVFSDGRAEVKVAKFSRKGDFIASGDAHGRVHILKVNGDKLALEKELQGVPGGPVFDLCWYPNDKGLATVGDSPGINARAFTLSGLDQGTITAPKRVVSVDMSPTGMIGKAFLMTGCDDNRARSYYNKNQFKNAEKDVGFDGPCNVVRFAPSGEIVAAAGGKDIKLVNPEDNFGVVHHIKNAHKGTIYGVAWSADSSRFLTCSSDKTVKLWDANTHQAITTFTMKGNSKYKRDVMDFQVGCCFAGEQLISLALSGDINYLDESSGKCGRVVAGPSGSLVSADVTADGSLASMSTSGEILLYSPDGNAKRSEGLDEPKKGVGAVLAGGSLYSASFDDFVRESKLPENKLSANKFALGQQPVYMSRNRASNDTFVVTTRSEVFIMKDAKKPVCSVKMTGSKEATCAALSADGSTLAVATTVNKKDNEVVFYAVNGGNATPSGRTFGKFDFPAECITFCETTGKVAVGLATKFVKVMTADGKDFCGDNWCRHSASVTDVSFSPDGNKLATCGIEGTIVIWDANDGDSFMPSKQLKLAHPNGIVACKWIDNNHLYSVGRFDGTVKKWEL